MLLLNNIVAQYSLRIKKKNSKNTITNTCHAARRNKRERTQNTWQFYILLKHLGIWNEGKLLREKGS